MLTFILIIIYVSFISLGLPDSLLGSAWPIMHIDIGIPLSSAGIISMIISGGTIFSSFVSDRIIRKLGTGKVTFISVFMTAVALAGFSISKSFYLLCIIAVPLGIGAGAVDSALNNFVAVHYKARHMSWLHCFWGIGATAGPVLMSLFLSSSNGWRKGYFSVSVIQIILTICLFFSLPLWKKFEDKNSDYKRNHLQTVSKKEMLSRPIVRYSLATFFCYSTIEMTAGLWGSSYLVNGKGIMPHRAAKWVSLFYLGITIGRFISGLISVKVSNKNLIRIGQIILVLGIILFIVPFTKVFCMIGFVLLGLGCAPIYPCMLHETPVRVGKIHSQTMMGIQMAFAYSGSTFMPFIFGIISEAAGIRIFPLYIFIVLIIMILCSEKTYNLLKDKG